VTIPPPSPPLPPAAPPPSPGRGRSGLAPVAALLTVLFVASVAVGWWLADRDDDGGDEAEAEAPTTTVAPLEEADVDRLVEELSAYVEDERELTFREAVDVEVLDSQDYQDRVQASAEEDLEEGEEDLEHAAGVYRAVGFWPDDAADPLEIAQRFAAVSSVGFYDPEEGELVILGSADTPNLRVTLVHELTHALEDQHFDLGRLEDLLDEEDESAGAFRSLIEGSASRVDTAYEATLSDEDREAIVAEQMDLLGEVDLGGIPPVLFAEQEAVYSAGEAFVDARYDEGGNAAVDDALEDPPTTSEQILEPEDWPERDPIVDVDQPEADGEVLESGVLGQAFWDLLVNGLFSGDDELPEWDGDHAVLWQDGDDYCLRAALAGDVEGYEEALADWAEALDAELTVDGEGEDELLVVTTCG
jgi:hypothetical protein